MKDSTSMNDDQKIEIGKRIAALRRSHNMTQEILAEKLDISIKHVSHVERGRASLSLKNLIELSSLLDCSLDYVLTGQFQDKAISQLPPKIIDVLHSGNEHEISRLSRYLKIYCEFLEDK